MMASWLRHKWLEKCVCGSGRPDPQGCLRREFAFAGIAVPAAVGRFAAVSGLNRRTFTLAVRGVWAAAGLAGGWIGRRLR
jgi:hypothetical protein